MNWGKWARERWKETRWGQSVYLSSLVTFFNLVLLISVKFNVTGSDFIILTTILLVGLTSLATMIGHFHRRIQQDTDALLENKAVINEIVRRIKEEKE